MKIDNVDFAEGFVEGFEKEKDFLKEMSSFGYPEIYKHETDRDGKLKKVYALHHYTKPIETDPEQPQGSIHEE